MPNPVTAQPSRAAYRGSRSPTSVITRTYTNISTSSSHAKAHANTPTNSVAPAARTHDTGGTSASNRLRGGARGSRPHSRIPDSPARAPTANPPRWPPQEIPGRKDCITSASPRGHTASRRMATSALCSIRRGRTATDARAAHRPKMPPDAPTSDEGCSRAAATPPPTSTAARYSASQRLQPITRSSGHPKAMSASALDPKWARSACSQP